MDARQDGQIRSKGIAEGILVVDELPACIADDERAFAVCRHEKHGFHTVTEDAHSADGGDTSQSDGAFPVADLELVVGIELVRRQCAAEVDGQLDGLAIGIGAHTLRQDDSVGTVFLSDRQHAVHPIVGVAVKQRVGAHDEGQFTEVELVETDHGGDGVFRVAAHGVGARDDVSIEDDGDAFIVGSGHLLGSEDNGVLLSILDGFGGDDIVGTVAHSHFTSLHFWGDVTVSIVVFVATGADQGQATEEHQTKKYFSHDGYDFDDLVNYTKNNCRKKCAEMFKDSILVVFLPPAVSVPEPFGAIVLLGSGFRVVRASPR